MMKKATSSILLAFIFITVQPASAQKELPKIAVWDLEPRNIPSSYARELTSILVSEVSKLRMPVDYSQIPTPDIEALKTGDLRKVSTHTLEMLAGELKKFEVYSQENVMTLAGWTAGWGLNSAVERRLSEVYVRVEWEGNSRQLRNLTPLMICGIIGPKIGDIDRPDLGWMEF